MRKLIFFITIFFFYENHAMSKDLTLGTVLLGTMGAGVYLYEPIDTLIHEGGHAIAHKICYNNYGFIHIGRPAFLGQDPFYKNSWLSIYPWPFLKRGKFVGFARKDQNTPLKQFCKSAAGPLAGYTGGVVMAKLASKLYEKSSSQTITSAMLAGLYGASTGLVFAELLNMYPWDLDFDGSKMQKSLPGNLQKFYKPTICVVIGGLTAAGVWATLPKQ